MNLWSCCLTWKCHLTRHKCFAAFEELCGNVVGLVGRWAWVNKACIAKGANCGLLLKSSVVKLLSYCTYQFVGGLESEMWCDFLWLFWCVSAIVCVSRTEAGMMYILVLHWQKLQVLLGHPSRPWCQKEDPESERRQQSQLRQRKVKKVCTSVAATSRENW